MNFKVGDKVRVRKDLIAGRMYDNLVLWEGHMSGLRGTEHVIEKADGDNNTYVFTDTPYWWHESMLESASPAWTLVIRPDKADPDKTVAIYNDGKTMRRETVRRYYKDEYHVDAAVRAVVGKLFPIATAEDVKFPVREAKRKANAGEYIKIVDARPPRDRSYKNGGVYPLSICSQILDDNGLYATVGPNEYVVLENYEPEQKPIMIGGKEPKVGSRFILKPYEAVENHHCISESKWNRLYEKALTVCSINRESRTPYVDTVNEYLFTLDAIDRIIEEDK